MTSAPENIIVLKIHYSYVEHLTSFLFKNVFSTYDYIYTCALVIQTIYGLWECGPYYKIVTDLYGVAYNEGKIGFPS